MFVSPAQSAFRYYALISLLGATDGYKEQHPTLADVWFNFWEALAVAGEKEKAAQKALRALDKIALPSEMKCMQFDTFWV